jgi:hypothetical protein
MMSGYWGIWRSGTELKPAGLGSQHGKHRQNSRSDMGSISHSLSNLSYTEFLTPSAAICIRANMRVYRK